MKKHPIELLIEKADTAINQEDFDTLIDIYSGDAVLVLLVAGFLGRMPPITR